MKRIVNSVVLLESLFWSLFFILGLCLVSCSQNEISSFDVTSAFATSNSTGTEVPIGNDDENDGILRMDDSSGDLPSTGHYFGYELKSRIPVDSDTFEVTLLVGHIHNINHFFWHTENGRVWVTDDEISKLDFSIELYDPEHPRHEILIESFDYLSDEYLIYDEIITYPIPEYLTPLDYRIVFASDFKITLNVKDIIVAECGEISFFLYQIDKEKGYKQSFNSATIFYKIFEEEIVFSFQSKPCTPYLTSESLYTCKEQS